MGIEINWHALGTVFGGLFGLFLLFLLFIGFVALMIAVVKRNRAMEDRIADKVAEKVRGGNPIGSHPALVAVSALVQTAEATDAKLKKVVEDAR